MANVTRTEGNNYRLHLTGNEQILLEQDAAKFKCTEEICIEACIEEHLIKLLKSEK